MVELADQAGVGDVPAVAATPASSRGGTRASPIDRHVSQRIRERRVLTGQTRQQMADLIGVTYQQLYKYEHGMNRLSVGRLYDIARALETPVSYFFEGLEKPGTRTPSSASACAWSWRGTSRRFATSAVRKR